MPSFTFEDGTTLPQTKVSYGTYGRLNARKNNVILLPSSYMADHHDNDWLIGFHGPRFPRATIRDNVPDFVDRIIALAGTARCWPHGVVRLESQIGALTSDPEFKDGNYTSPPKQGLHLFGLVWAPWLTSQQWWHEELWRGPTWPPGDSFQAVMAYFADSLFATLDANDLILQARTWERHDVGTSPGFDGSIERALRSIKARVLYLPVQTDLYFPVSDARAEARLIPRVELAPIPSLWGHVAGGGGDEGSKRFINERVAAFLRR